jgi:hypothetical protein
MTWQPPKDLDRECLALCKAMNRLPGIETTESCCGHGKHEYLIFFKPKSFDAMLPILYLMDSCHTAVQGRWIVRAYTDCSADRARFVLEGPIGEIAYSDSIVIAEALEEWK